MLKPLNQISLRMPKRLTLAVVVMLLAGIGLGQTKKPLVFRMQEKALDKRLHRYTRCDTLVETDNASIRFYYSNKPGKPYLLLLHGMGLDAKSNWNQEVKQLSKHYNLLLPDLIYFGKSTSKKQDYSVEFQARELHQALTLLKITGKIQVMGFSYGGLTAAMYNELYPEQVNKLIIVDGPVKFYSGRMADSMARLVGVPSIINIIVPQNLKDFAALEASAFEHKIPLSRGLKQKYIDTYFLPTVPVRQAQMNYIMQNDKRYQTYTYNLDKCPTLLVWGEKDGVVPLLVAERLHQQFAPNTQLVVFKKAKHDCYTSCHKQLTEAALNFLKN